MSASRPTLGDAVSKTLNRVRRRGPLEAGGDLWGRLRSHLGSQGRLQVLQRATGGTPEHRPDMSFRRATAGDAYAYARDIATDSVGTFRARLTDQTRCYLVESRGRLLHASWVTTGSAWTAELSAFLSPPPGDAYIYESFTRPETRGRGIYPFALHNICAELAGRGIGRAWVAVEATNAASLRAMTKAGFELAFELPFHRERGKVRLEPAEGPRAALAETFLSQAPRASQE